MLRLTSYFLFLLFLFSACKGQERDIRLLSQAVEKMDQAPDTALRLLDSIKDPTSLRKKDFHWYVVNRVRAKYKNYQDISADTLIFQSVDYFRKEYDADKLAYALFYSGVVYGEQGNTQKQMLHFIEAEKEVDDNNIVFKNLIFSTIAQQHYHAFNLQESLAYYKKAISVFSQQSELYLLQIIPDYINIANIYLVESKIDSAFHYYTMALDEAERIKHPNLKELYQNIGVAYNSVSMPDSAQKYLLKVIRYANDTLAKVQIYNSIATLYLNSGKDDSANYYAEKIRDLLPSVKKKETVAAIESNLAKIAYLNGQYDIAYEEAMKYAHTIYETYEDKLAQNILEVQKKYDLVRKNEELQALTRERRYIIGTSALLILLLASTTFFAITNRKKDQKVQELKEENQAIERRQLMYINQSFVEALAKANVFDQKADELIIRHDIKEQSAGYRELKKLFQNARKENKMQMAATAHTFLNKNISLELPETLTDGDKIYLALLQCNVPNIAVITNSTPHALRTRKASIRKKLLESGVPSYRIDSLFNE